MSSEINYQKKRPFSKAVKAGNTLYLAGQVGINHDTGTFPSDFVKEVRLAIKNVTSVLEEYSYQPKDIVKVVVLITDVKLVPVFNEIYSEWFGEVFPARTLFIVQLQGAARVELDVTAYQAE